MHMQIQIQKVNVLIHLFMVGYSDSASHFRSGGQDQSNYNEVADGVVCGSQQRCSGKNTGILQETRTSIRQNHSVVCSVDLGLRRASEFSFLYILF